MEKKEMMEAKELVDDAKAASVEKLSDECLDLSELENVEGGKVIVVGCGKENGKCSLSQAQLEDACTEP